MADEEETKNTEQPAEEAPTGGLVKKLFSRKKGGAEPEAPEEGTAHIPSTVLTVEYVDESEGMDASLREMEERLRQMQETVSNMQETQSQLIAAVNQQAKDIGRFIESVGRRIDKLYRRVSGGRAPQPGEPPESPPRDLDGEEIGVETGPAPEVADDPEHQNAWRIARVLAADLEAYHEESVKEGVLYGTFHKLLREPLEQARETYEQRVDAEIVENYDYFSKALDELIARKRMELEEEGAL
ncbi:MAG: hypothetical protein ACOC7T_00465 [Planctomycetota bacterium]